MRECVGGLTDDDHLEHVGSVDEQRCEPDDNDVRFCFASLSTWS